MRRFGPVSARSRTEAKLPRAPSLMPERFNVPQRTFAGDRRLSNPATLMGEIRHELAYHFAGGPGGVPRLGETPFSALELLETIIQGRGKLPLPLLP